VKEFKREPILKEIFGGIEWKPYICTVIFFIVLDLRLTKVGARRCSFFYAYH